MVSRILRDALEDKTKIGRSGARRTRGDGVNSCWLKKCSEIESLPHCFLDANPQSDNLFLYVSMFVFTASVNAGKDKGEEKQILLSTSSGKDKPTASVIQPLLLLDRFVFCFWCLYHEKAFYLLSSLGALSSLHAIASDRTLEAPSRCCVRLLLPFRSVPPSNSQFPEPPHCASSGCQSTNETLLRSM